ncbi:helix-turn-helix domain-containing protein [Simiduia sp. 21SJ11W-1]|uniref:helix-turn-helix domain-containing protein n=1 Tax=Simiduia sp. 21SJ11W-1 TaxID=2909669 RepID=UPI00209FD849|nr:helix-turn-helix domain-containing protein [Simiduia sp. 21SJ11W-1]UTA46332.1 helix-turn-helix domain-containing protein [Simiduia sp. 21SJ11W-1]
MRVLLRLSTAPVGGFQSQLWSYLAAGCAMLGASQAFFFHRTLGRCSRYRYEQGMDSQSLVLAEESFGATHQALFSLNTPQFLDVFDENCDNPLMLAYTHAGPGRYLLAPLANASAALVFVLKCPEDRGQNRLADDDSETLALLAEGVARMVHLHASPDKILRSQEGFAVSGIRSLEEYIEIAKLPAVFGIPGRVMDVLQRRVGQGSLAIDDVANELSISKRTLQRRLQQADINFAMMRDQVRFHYAIGFLVDQNLSIDQISTALDFSDRTSFTNAFKRWTGLSPSTFRKLFRDYT